MDWIGLDWIREWIEEKDMERLLMGMVTTMMVTTIVAVLVVCPWVFRPGFCCHIVPSLPFCSPALPSMTFPRKNNRELRLVLCFFLVLGCFFIMDHWGWITWVHWGQVTEFHFQDSDPWFWFFLSQSFLGKFWASSCGKLKNQFCMRGKCLLSTFGEEGNPFWGVWIGVFAYLRT